MPRFSECHVAFVSDVIVSMSNTLPSAAIILYRGIDTSQSSPSLLTHNTGIISIELTDKALRVDKMLKNIYTQSRFNKQWGDSFKICFIFIFSLSRFFYVHQNSDFEWYLPCYIWVVSYSWKTHYIILAVVETLDYSFDSFSDMDW